MSDSAYFADGALFTTDYLVTAVRDEPAYKAVDADLIRSTLVALFRDFPRSARTNESQTEDDLIWPVLSELGWADTLRQQNLSAAGRDDVPDGLLFADPDAKARANTHLEEWRRYGLALALVESKRWDRPLDRASGRDEATAPSTQMLRYLRRVDDLTHGALRWGILTNGARWRLYWAGARSVSEDFLELDLGRILDLDGGDLFADDADREHWLRVFVVMFSRSAFLRTGPDASTFHDHARNQALFYEERVAANLATVVFEKIFPSLAAGIRAEAPQAALSDVRDGALILLYRLLFILYAEDRNLLPVRDVRYDDYALRPLRLEVGKRSSAHDVFADQGTKIWAHLSDLTRMIDKGDSEVGIPPYNGGLFAPSATLDAVRLSDRLLAPVIDALSYERQGDTRRYINYRDLSVQQLGSIYERLLEFEIAEDDTGVVVRPNTAARKGSGSYYTPDNLVALILSETLDPLISERRQRLYDTLSALSPEAPLEEVLDALRLVDPAEAILQLRICDPAMGSGHFLVSLVDVLADHVLDAMAETASLGATFHHVSPLAGKIEEIRSTILRNARHARWAVEAGQLDDRHIVRRMILKRCIYGADKNAMAVELAKVSLWLHTFTVGAPLSFVDHHLRSGDSLFGLWIPEAIDRARARGGGALLYASALAEAQSAAAQMQLIERSVDAEIAEAHRSADTYLGIQAQVAPLDRFVSFLHALDWLDVKNKEDKVAITAWLDGLFGNPIDIAQGRTEPTLNRARAEQGDRFLELRDAAFALMKEERFLNWQVAFPGVWQNWSAAGRTGGFDAVVGNPPWDRFEFEELPWFEARDPKIALAPTGAARKALIKALKEAEDPLWVAFNRASAKTNMAARVAKTGKIYSELNTGKLNLFKLFVERAGQLVKPDGMIGLLVPSGIAADQSSSGFFRRTSVGGHLKSFFDFENKAGLFADVHRQFKFAALIFSPQRTFEAADCAFFLRSTDDLRDADRRVKITAGDFARFNPNTGTAPIFRSQQAMSITAKLYAKVPVLIDRSGPAVQAAWPVRYMQSINLTSDSGQFRTRVDLEEREGAWRSGANRFTSASGEWLPLYEGKMIWHFDHRRADVVVNPANPYRAASARELSEEDHADPDRSAEPQFWVPAGLPGVPTGVSLSFRDVTNPTDRSTMVAALLPNGSAGNSLPLILNGEGADALQPLLLCANLNAIGMDFLSRQKVQKNHLNWYIVEQLPFIPPAAYARRFGETSAQDLVVSSVLELSYTSTDMAELAVLCGYVDGKGAPLPPFPWNEDRRERLRARLNALYFILYGLFDDQDFEAAREEVRYIFSTFPLVQREELARHGAYRSRDLCLAWISALLAGQPEADVTL